MRNQKRENPEHWNEYRVDIKWNACRLVSSIRLCQPKATQRQICQWVNMILDEDISITSLFKWYAEYARVYRTPEIDSIADRMVNDALNAVDWARYLCNSLELLKKDKELFCAELNKRIDLPDAQATPEPEQPMLSADQIAELIKDAKATITIQVGGANA